MCISRIGIVVTAMTAFTAPAMASTHASPEAVIDIRTVEGGGQTLDASIAGRPGAFLFDSGWGVSAVTPRFAAEIGCKPWGQLTGFRATGERQDIERCDFARLQLGKLALAIPTLGVIDVMRFLSGSTITYAGAIGLDAFAGRTITICSKAKQLIVESRFSLAARVAHARSVPIRIVRDVEGAALTVDLGVPTASGMVWMELDTGNYGVTMIGRHVAALVGLDPSIKHAQRLTMRISPGITVEGMARVDDLILDGNIGKDFLDHWNLTLDLANGRGWLAPAD